jgi:hypothetical protein
MFLYHVSRLHLISEIEEDQFCEVVGINYHELIVVVCKRIVFRSGIKTTINEFYFVHFIRSHNIVASIVHPSPWLLPKCLGFISQQGWWYYFRHTQNRCEPHRAFFTADSRCVLLKYKVVCVWSCWITFIKCQCYTMSGTISSLSVCSIRVVGMKLN